MRFTACARWLFWIAVGLAGSAVGMAHARPPEAAEPANLPPKAENPGSRQPPRVLLETSKDGGVWWFPQGPNGFDPNQHHQGKRVADLIRSRGYDVIELPRGDVITEQRLRDFDFVIRPEFYFPYSTEEVKAYVAAVSGGTRLILFGQAPKKGIDSTDAIAQAVGIRFAPPQQMVHVAAIDNPIARGITQRDRPWFTVTATPADTLSLAWLDKDVSDAKPVMGYCRYGKGDIVFLGTALPQQTQSSAVVDILDVLKSSPASQLMAILSATQSKKTEVASLAAPRLVTPVAGAQLPQPNVGAWRFEWQPTPGARLYEIIVLGATASTPLVAAQTTSPEYVLAQTSAYIVEHNLANWTWQVRAQDEAGRWGAWSDARPFSVALRISASQLASTATPQVSQCPCTPTARTFCHPLRIARWKRSVYGTCVPIERREKSCGQYW